MALLVVAACSGDDERVLDAAPPPDAFVPPDSAVSDAPADAPDAPLPDAPLPDAPLHDAPPPDAPPPDAPSPDSPPPDAPPPDAPPPDAPSPDAAPHECDVDADCGAHAWCDLIGPGTICRCVASYEWTAGGCAWGGGLRDPGFQDPTAWTVSGGAYVYTTAAGSWDPGEGLLSTEALYALGFISQVVDMPAWDDAEPLVLVTRTVSLGLDFAFSERVPSAVAINGAWHFLGKPTGWWTATTCLGERAFGGPVEFRFGGHEQALSDSMPLQTKFDHARIDVAAPGLCPTPGDVTNGDLEGTGGWTLLYGAAAVAGAGTGSSRGVVLPGCSFGTAHLDSVSIPLASVPSPAIELTWRASPGMTGSIGVLRGDRFASLVGQGLEVTRTSRACIPPWNRGMVETFYFRAETGGSCTAPDPPQLIFDDVRIVSEPACAADELILDPGFERAAGGALHAPSVMLGGWSTGTARVAADPALAHDGAGALELSSSSPCGHGWAQIAAYVPAPSALGGPAVRFWHDIPDNPQTETNDLPEGGGWTEATVCIDPIWAGRPIWLAFEIAGLGGTCAELFPTEVARFDDIEVINDPSCP